MNPVLRDLLWQWQWRPEVIFVLVALGAAYSIGWRRLRRRGHAKLARGWRLIAYLSGLAVVALALLSPIDVLVAWLFSVHMVQHLLLTMVAAPLLMLANPMPFTVWGLPADLRRAVQWALAREGLVRRFLRFVGPPWIALALATLTLWGWHLPAAYDGALRNDLLHDLEHLTFFWTALLFWWGITGAAPHVRPPTSYGLRIIFVLLGLAQNEALGVAITLARQPLYPFYTEVPRLWGIAVLDDQALAGAIMWVPAGMMYVVAVLVLLSRLIDQDEKRTAREDEANLRALGGLPT